MLSRVADNLYWFGRYLQRAENGARLVTVHANLLLDLPQKVIFGWGPLIEILGADATFREHYPDDTENNAVRFLLTDERNPGSILSSLNAAREILRTTRDFMTNDAWEKLNDLYYYVHERGGIALSRSKRQEFTARVIDSTLLLHGLLSTTMAHDVGFEFLRIGTHLEQADMTTRIIDVRSSSLIRANGEALAPFQSIQWMSVLRSLTAYQMYRRQMRARVTGSQVLRFLLQNREFPRSVLFCLNTIAGSLPHLPERRAVERTVDRARALVLDANFERLMETGLHELMDEIQIGLGEVHIALHKAYFEG